MLNYSWVGGIFAPDVVAQCNLSLLQSVVDIRRFALSTKTDVKWQKQYQNFGLLR